VAKREQNASAKKAKKESSSSSSGSSEADKRRLSLSGADGKELAERAAAVVQDLSTHLAFPAFAPLKVPMYRRRQTLALFVSSFFSLWCCAFALLLIRAQGWPFYLFLAYLVWMFFFQDYHKNGRGFKSNKFRSMGWWRWFRDYFPISLHATTPLKPEGRYVFGYHPHGILSLGAFLNFGSEATGFGQKFPGIDLRLMTLTSNFRIPFYGLMLSMMGIMDASRESCNNCLSRGPGSAILLVLGGAKESLDAHAHSDYELTLHRKGFVKVALENHADLVPVFSFGENDVWDQVSNPRGSTLRNIQDRLQQLFGFAFPLVKGRGIFQYNFGLLPHRRPITTFVGAPVVLPKLAKEDITDAVINESHERYKQALEELFRTYAPTFAPHRKLIFVKPAQSGQKRGKERGAVPAAASTETAEPQQPPTADVVPPVDADADEAERQPADGSILVKRK